jgi:hypothetical protein
MDDRQLRALHDAVRPILQRTCPTAAQSKVRITPAALDQIGWGIVLAYIVNVSDRPPTGMPSQARSGEGSLREEEVRSAVEILRRAEVRPRLEPEEGRLARFAAAARRILEANGWAPQRAAQAADEAASRLQKVRS